MDDGIKTLGLHLCATCRELSAAHFDSICFKSFYYYVYRLSHLLQDNVLGVISDPIEVKVGFLKKKIRTCLDLVSIPQSEGKCQNVKVRSSAANTKPLHGI